MICNVNTFIINHIFFRLGLTFMNIKAVWMGSAGLWEYVCRGGGVLAACAVLGDAIWIRRRAKGAAAGGREAERERVCVRQRKNPSALERDGRKGGGSTRVNARGHFSVSRTEGQAGARAFSLETSRAAGLGEGVRREGEAWPELAASGFVPGSGRCRRRVRERACAPCAARMGDSCLFTCRTRGESPRVPSSHRLARGYVPGAGAGCCPLCAARLSTSTGNLSGITVGCSQARGGSQSK